MLVRQDWRPYKYMIHNNSIKKDCNIKSKSDRLRRVFPILFLLIFLISLYTVSASADTGLKIYINNSNKHDNYTGPLANVTIDSENIKLGHMPSIILDNVTMVRAKRVFADSSINADYKYNKKNKTIILEKGNRKVEMQIGSNIAYLNGEAVTMDYPPLVVTNKEVDRNYVMVPGNSTAKLLGYDYIWDNPSRTSRIITTEATKETSDKTDKTEDKIEEDITFPLSINHGNSFDYNGSLCSATIDDKEISLGNMPSIILDNVTMVRAKRVFADSDIGASYKYNKKDKTITLEKGNRKVEMQVGSPVAYLNGEAVALDMAPLVATNKKVGTNFVMVPGRSIANLLGFDYIWDNPSRTSRIISRDERDIDKEEKGQNNKDKGNETPLEPELGGDKVVIEEGNILYQWNVTESLYGYSSGTHDIELDKNNEVGFIHTITRDYSNTNANAERYMFYATSPFSSVTSKVDDKIIKIQADNMQVINNTYYMAGSNNNYVKDIFTTCDFDKSISFIEMNMEADDFTYDIALSEDKMFLYVTVYINGLSSVKVGTNDNGDYISLKGLKPLDVNVYKQNGMINIDLPYTKDGAGDQNIIFTDAKYINMVYSYYLNDSTKILIGGNQDLDYYIAEEGDLYSILFVPSEETSDTPQVPDDTYPQPGYEIPNVQDKSKYNVLIPKPKDIKQNYIKHKDNYYQNRFSIVLPGDYRSFYNNNSILNNVSTIRDISVSLNKNNETEIIISTSKLQGYELAIDEDYIYIRVGEPREIYKNIVILDPGHGGPAPGAIHFNTKEKDLNYKMLYEIGEKYFNSNPSQLKVYYTRETDVDMSLSDRAAFAKKMGADLFVSLHMNASTSSSAHGTEVYYSASNNSPNKAGLTSEKMAKILVDNLASALGTNNRGAKSSRYTVVHKNTVPAVLVELAFMSNKNDFNKISDPEIQEIAVRTIYESLLQIFYQYPTGR